MALSIVPYGMGYTEWAKRTHRPTNLEWIRRNSVKRKRIKKIKSILNGNNV